MGNFGLFGVILGYLFFLLKAFLKDSKIFLGGIFGLFGAILGNFGLLGVILGYFVFLLKAFLKDSKRFLLGLFLGYLGLFWGHLVLYLIHFSFNKL